MKAPDRIQANPTSLPYRSRGHGIVVTFNEPGSYWPESYFLDLRQAVELRDAIDQAIEKGIDRATA